MMGHVNNPMERASTTYTGKALNARGVPHRQFRSTWLRP
jgi:hypothetical protein